MHRFKSFHQLRCQAVEGRDYIIDTRKGYSGLAVMAPHGGGIEPGTDSLAAAVAGHAHSYYAFNGIRPRNNAELHIQSQYFDEPRALALSHQVDTIVTLHGCRGAGAAVYVGGLADATGHRIVRALREAGFDAGKCGRPYLRGVHPDNLCNRGRSGMGIQLELSEPLRRQLLGGSFINRMPPTGNDRFWTFVRTIRRVLAQIG